MNHVSLFAGIDAMSLAAERLGYKTTFAVEIDPFCQKVIAKRFPLTTILGDIREVKGSDLGHVDLMSGGSPCQDLSSAGKGKGLDGDRSGLWFEYLRLIGEVRPSLVLLENVAVLRSRGLDVVVNGLASIDYFCWWDCVPALAVGAPHLRDRIWVTAVPYEMMPELEGAPFKEITTKFPRAGASTARGLIEMKPQATIKMCKEAMGAVKREDGVTWLTAIDQPLFPTPSSSYGSNRGGAAGRVGPIRHSLASMAKSGDWPEEIPCFPTPTVGDSRNSTAGRTPGGNHHDGTTLSDFMRLWPSSSSRDWKDVGEGRMGRGQLPEAVRAESKLFPTPCATDYKGANPLSRPRGDDDLPTRIKRQEEQMIFPTPRRSDGERGGRGDLIQVVRGNKTDSSHGEQRLWPTATAHPRTHTPRPVHHGMQLANEVAAEEQRIWPTAAAADSLRGPGRSPHRNGGPNLRTAVADEKPGPLNPYWVEWLMKIPVGWTDLSCDDPIQYDNLSEYNIPRTAKDIEDRKDRLMCVGNSLCWPVAYTRIKQAHRLLGIFAEPVEDVA